MNARKLGALTVSPIDMSCMGLSHGDGDIPDRAYSMEAIRRAHGVTPLSAVQSIYSSMVERGVVEAVIPYCLENHIGFVPFSPIARGFLSGKVTEKPDFSHSDDVRKYVPQLRPENLAANRPILDLLDRFARQKNAAKAQIFPSWMLHKYPNVVPIPGSKNQERISENLGAWNVVLTPAEFAALEDALAGIPVRGHRGFVEQQGGRMKNWSKNNAPKSLRPSRGLFLFFRRRGRGRSAPKALYSCSQRLELWSQRNRAGSTGPAVRSSILKPRKSPARFSNFPGFTKQSSSPFSFSSQLHKSKNHAPQPPHGERLAVIASPLPRSSRKERQLPLRWKEGPWNLCRKFLASFPIFRNHAFSQPI